MSEIKRRSGFSLVELMVALLLGTLLLLGAGRLFSSFGELYSLLEGQLRMQENATFALNFIAKGAHSAGYLGCNARPEEMVNVLRGGWHRTFEFNIQTPIQGVAVDAENPLNLLNLLPISKPMENGLSYIKRRGLNATLYRPEEQELSNPAVGAGRLVSNSDILVVRQMSSDTFRLARPAQPEEDLFIKLRDKNNNGRIELTDLNNFGISRGRAPILMISDCRRAVVFRATKIRRVSGNEARLQHKAGQSTDFFANTQAGLASVEFNMDARVGGIETTIFYIATGTGTNNRNQPVLSLWRKRGTAAPQELVEGVERLKIFCGLDTNSDSAPNQYVPLAEVTDFNTVVALRVLLLVSSVDVVYLDASPGQGLLRRVFVRTFHLKNV